MYKTLLSFLTLLLAVTVTSAQMVSVEVSVDMSNETVDPDGVHIAGDWDPDNKWDPGSTMLTEGTDGVWSITLMVAQNSRFEYKFINGKEWGKDEGLDGIDGCTAPADDNGNRSLFVGTEDVTVATACFNSCGICTGADEYSVTLQVDMSLEDTVEDSIIVTGSFAGWIDSIIMVDNNNDSIYSATVTLPAGDYQYKFKNGPSGWESVSGDCTDGGNRTISVSADTIVTPVCFTLCDACVVTNDVYVRLVVDMSLPKAIDGLSANGIYVAGSFQRKAGYENDWTPGITELTDEDGDDVYEVVFLLPEGEYEFKYLNGNAWGTEESIPEDCKKEGTSNRGLSVAGSPGDTITVGPICFSGCDATCPAVLDPIELTFQVDMRNEFVSENGLFVAGDFLQPKWDKDTFQLTENANQAGLYQFTTMVRPGFSYAYKYFNGGLDGVDNGEEGFEFKDTDGCGVDNGFGGSNRLLDLRELTTDTLLPIVVFNSCDVSDIVSVEEITYLDEFKAYPNPVEQELIVEFSNEQNLRHRVELYNLAGQQVKATVLDYTNKIQFSISTGTAGSVPLTCSLACH
ncbi:MAG: T9SS type A sorting domain-containing protein, partial [Bacteroidota bacterium]